MWGRRHWRWEGAGAVSAPTITPFFADNYADKSKVREATLGRRDGQYKDDSEFCRKKGVPCEDCPTRTPFRPDPEKLRRAKESIFEPPLDEGIREIVITLLANGVETFESCEGGDGHAFPWPTVRFEGAASEGLRALSVALENGLPVDFLRRSWGIIDGAIHGPWWEMTFLPPRGSPLWVARDTASRYAAQKPD